MLKTSLQQKYSYTIEAKKKEKKNDQRDAMK